MNEGLITDDMSERIVTSLPKCLSDSTMRGSRESLRSSVDSVRSSCDSLWRGVGVTGSCQQGVGVTDSCDNVSSLSTTSMSDTGQVPRADRRRRWQWKLLKRAVWRWIDAHTQSNTQRHTHRSLHSYFVATNHLRMTFCTLLRRRSQQRCAIGDPPS